MTDGKFSEWLCPRCRGRIPEDLRCRGCGRQYGATAQGQLDFRLTEHITLSHAYRYDPEFGRFPWERVALQWPEVQNGLEQDPTWENVERNMFRSIPRAPTAGVVALDLGCGESHQRFNTGLARLGYATLGVDIAGAAPDVLADLHRLPIPDGAVHLLVTSSVFEHLKHPHIAMSEAARVAAPSARFVGNIAFGQPFHISYFHPSLLATFDMLDASGFELETVVISDHYNAFYAHLDMGFAGARLPAMLRRGISEVLRAAALAPASVRSALTRQRGPYDRARLAFARSHTGEVGFIAHRRPV